MLMIKKKYENSINWSLLIYFFLYFTLLIPFFQIFKRKYADGQWHCWFIKIHFNKKGSSWSWLSHQIFSFLIYISIVWYNFDTLFGGCFGPPEELQRLRFDPKYFPFQLWRTKGDWRNGSNFKSSPENKVTLESGRTVNLLGENPFCIHFTGSNDMFDAAMSIGIIEENSPTKPGILWIDSKWGKKPLDSGKINQLLSKKDLVDDAWGNRKKQLLLIVTTQKLSDNLLEPIRQRKDVLIVCKNQDFLSVGLSPSFARILNHGVFNKVWISVY